MKIWHIFIFSLIVVSSGCTSDLSSSPDEIKNGEELNEVNYSEPKSVAKHHTKYTVKTESFDLGKALVLTHKESELREEIKVRDQELQSKIDGFMSNFRSFNMTNLSVRELDIKNHSYKLNKGQMENKLGENVSLDNLVMIDVLINLEGINRGGITLVMAQEDNQEWKVVDYIFEPTRVGKASNPDKKVEVVADFDFPEKNEDKEGEIAPDKVKVRKGEKVQIKLKSNTSGKHKLRLPAKYISTAKTNSSSYLNFQFNQTGEYKFGVEVGHFLNCHSFIGTKENDRFTDRCLSNRVREGLIVVE